MQKRPGYQIASVDRALTLLLMFRTSRSLRVSEVSRALGVAESTAHRLLAMLVHHGFVAQDPRTRAYVPGGTLIEVGLAAVENLDVRAVARPWIRRLCDETEETVHIGLLRGSHVLFIDGIESRKGLRAGLRIGVTMPAHCAAAGKILLAGLPPSRVLELFPAEELEPATSASIRSRTRLMEELNLTRERGYATSYGESETDLSAVATAINERTGGPVASLVVTAPTSRVDQDWEARVAHAAMESSRQIGDQLKPDLSPLAQLSEL